MIFVDTEIIKTPSQTVALLEWDVRNANEPTGAWAFETEALAIAQVEVWLDDCGLSKAEVARRLKELRDDGYCQGPKSDDTYSVSSAEVRTEVSA